LPIGRRPQALPLEAKFIGAEGTVMHARLLHNSILLSVEKSSGANPAQKSISS
jgi:hypothetical protein